MSEESSVIRQIPPPHPGMDFWALRQEGLNRIIELGSNIWTDFNVHDPGITILEVLCYAITDLSYRTNLPIGDLLAKQTGRVVPPGMPAPPEVLSCYPVTTYDLRKVLIDLDGVKNAWIFKRDHDPEVAFNIMEADPVEVTPAGYNLKVIRVRDFLNQPANPLAINGLYEVLIDLDEDALYEGCQAETVLQNVRRTLHHYRNLCEDIVNVEAVAEQPVYLCVAIDLEPDAPTEETLAEICYAVQEFLTPSVPFYGLEEMLDRRGTRSLDAVFEGPLLANGFIDESDLAAAELRREIYTSDLYSLIFKIPGVKQVQGVKIKIGSSWEEWKSGLLNDRQKPVLTLNGGNISVTRYGTPQTPNMQEVQERWEQLRWVRRPMTARDRTAVTYPSATFRPDLGDYFSIQHDFPQTYAVGDEGLSDQATPLRRAQQKQLKAYLTFFDQILANYLVHLTQVKDLLNGEQSDGSPAGANLLEAIPFATEILGEGYADFVQKGTDSAAMHLRQHNALLDHLLARFGEVFADYSLITWYDDPDTTGSRYDFLVQQERNVHEKIQLLRLAPILGGQRGTGFDYKKCLPENPDYPRRATPDVWNTTNVEGLKKRVCALLGIGDPSRKTLTCPPAYVLHFPPPEVYVRPSKGKPKPGSSSKTYLFELKSATGKHLLDAYPGLPTDPAIRRAALELEKILARPDNYKMLRKTGNGEIFSPNSLSDDLNEAIFNKLAEDEAADFTLQKESGQGGLRLYIAGEDRKMLARSAAGVTLDTVEDLYLFLTELKATVFNEACNNEGFHIVEHILLRPRYRQCADGDPALDLRGCLENIDDPYSFWITVVAPDRWKRFIEPENRKFFERALREETPAHIGVRLCWLDNDTMYRFEQAYGSWLLELAAPRTDSCDLDRATVELVNVMNTFEGCSCCGHRPELPVLECK